MSEEAESSSDDEENDAEIGEKMTIPYEVPDVSDNIFHQLVFGQYYPNFNKQLFCTSAIMLNNLGYGFFNGLFRQYLHYNDIKKKEWPVLDKLHWYFYPFGLILGCSVTKNFGRQKALLFSFVPLWFTLLLLVMPYNFQATWMAFLTMSIADAWSTLTNVIYIGEIAEADLRGFFLALINASSQLGLTFGQMVNSVNDTSTVDYVRIVDNTTTWEPMIVIWIIIPCLSMILMLAIPETPIWLLLNDRPITAQMYFFWLHGYTAKSVEEFEKLIDYANKHLLRQNQSVLKNIFTGSFIKPLIIVTLLYTVKISFVYDTLVFYGSFLFHILYWAEAAKYKLEGTPRFISVLVEMFATISSAALVLLIYRCKRRSIFLISCVFAGFAVAAQIYDSRDPAYDMIRKDSAFFLIYLIFMNFGIIPIPYLISAEYFPQNLREFGVMCTLLYAYYWEDQISQYDILHGNSLYEISLLQYLLVTIVCVSIVLYFVMPETKALSLQEIEKKIRKKSFVSAYKTDDRS